VIKPGSETGDRRRVCRYRVVLEDALLGWWQDSCFTNVPARLINLSLQGCLVELQRLPDLSPRQSVWVHPHKESQVGWFEGRIISVRKPLLRQCKVRILFLAPLGYEPFKKLVYGPEYLSDGCPRVAPAHEQDHFWK
jgi:hypothetical protein